MEMSGEKVLGSSSNGTEKDNSVMRPVCVGRDNSAVTSNQLQILIPRNISEKITIVRGFMRLCCPQFGGCMSPDCEYATKESPIHFFGLFDGHYESPQEVEFRAEMLSKLIAEEWSKEADGCDWSERWGNAIYRAVEQVEREFQYVFKRSTMLVAIVSPCQVLLANDDDSKAILFRGANAYPLLDRQIHPTLPIPIPKGYIEVVMFQRDEADDFLFLATDGLYESVSCDRVKNSLDKETRDSCRDRGRQSASPAEEWVADIVITQALKNMCNQNISLIVVDLKWKEGV